MIKDSFKECAAGALLVASAMMPFAAANADSGQCAPLAQTSYGKSHDASTSAHIYSEDNIGHVGIVIYPGADLEKSGFSADQLGTKLVEVLAKAGVDAECYVNNSMFENSGTSVSFKIDGLSIQIDGDDSFNMKQIQTDKRILVATVNEAKMTKYLLASRDDTLTLAR